MVVAGRRWRKKCRWNIKVLVAMNEFPCATEMLLLLVAKCSDEGANGFLNAMPMELKSGGLGGESKLQNGELHGANI